GVARLPRRQDLADGDAAPGGVPRRPAEDADRQAVEEGTDRRGARQARGANRKQRHAGRQPAAPGRDEGSLMMQKNVVIAGYLRSPFTFAHKGEMVKLRPDEMAAQVVRGLVERSGIDAK